MTEGLLVKISQEREQSVPHSEPRRACSNQSCTGCWEESERVRQVQEEAWENWVRSWEGHGGWPS